MIRYGKISDNLPLLIEKMRGDNPELITDMRENMFLFVRNQG